MDYYKLVKENKEQIVELLKGKIINYECPYCNRERQINIITLEKAVCMECKNEFPIKIRLHLD